VNTLNTMQMAMASLLTKSYRRARELQELRLRHERADAQRAMSWFALWGMLLYPSLVVVSEFFGMNQAASILGDMAAVYFVSVAGILAAFFGAQAWSNRK
jgi:hypothetical protein